MSLKSWHDSDDVNSEDEIAAYNLLYKNNQLKNEIKSNNNSIDFIENLSKIDLEEKNKSEKNIILISDSDSNEIFVEKKIKCKNKVRNLYVGIDSNDSDDSFYDKNNLKNSSNFSREIIVNIDNNNNENNRKRKDSAEILSKLIKIRNNLSNKSMDDNDWTIDEIDNEPRVKNRNRYFEESKSHVCEVCQKRGHSRAECARSGPVCILCGKEGHISNMCDDIICHICFQTDHISKKCPNSAQFLRTPCRRCGQRGHIDQICPDLWRQYKYTLSADNPVMQPCSSQNRKTVFCANCSRNGHFTEMCPRNRMTSKFIGPAPIMEVVRFDTVDIYKSYGLSYNACPPDVCNKSYKSTEDVDSVIMNMDVTGLVDENMHKNEVKMDYSMDQSCSSAYNVESESRDFGDGYIMLSPIVQTQVSKKNNKKIKNILCSTPMSQVNNYSPLKIDENVIDSSMPSLPESLLKTLFPEETRDFEKISPSLRAKLRKKLKNMLKNGYLPGDSEITQDRMEFWLQDVSTGRSLNYREKKKLLGSVSAAIHSISDRVSNVTTDELKNLPREKEFVIKRDIAESRKKRNKNNRQRKSLQNEIKMLQKENKNTTIDLTLDDIEDIPLKIRLRKRKKGGRFCDKKKQKMGNSGQLQIKAVTESVY